MNMSETRICIRPYPRTIFFYPLFIFSLIAYFIQLRQEKLMIDGGAPISWLSICWLIMLCANFMAISFNYTSWKFTIIFLIVVAIVQTSAYLVNIGVIPSEFIYRYNLNIHSTFYLLIVGILGFNLFFIMIDMQRNSVLLTDTEVLLKRNGKTIYRHPLHNIEVNYEIPDMMKYIALGSGTFTLSIPNQQSLVFENIPFIKSKYQKSIELIEKNIIIIQNQTSS
jgi:hypothetical protein